MTTFPAYKKGTLFMVCTHDELYKKGWVQDLMTRYIHDDFDQCILTYDMIEKYQTQVLTVLKETPYPKWYYVSENEWKWPVATFLITDPNPCKEICVHIKGITPIFGWFICKLCGTNLEEIKQ